MQVQPVLERADLADRQRRFGVAGALHGAAGLTRSVRTLPAAGAVAMNFAHFCINARRFSNRSPRRQAASVASPTAWASAISATSLGVLVRSAHLSRYAELTGWKAPAAGGPNSMQLST
jgi:hypothetical protein